MERHAALPEGKRFQGVCKKVRRLVEKDVAQAPASDHAEDPVEQQVVEVPPGDRRRRPGCNASRPQPPERGKGRQVHQAVPADGKRTDGEGDGIETGMDQHVPFMRCGART